MNFESKQLYAFNKEQEEILVNYINSSDNFKTKNLKQRNELMIELSMRQSNEITVSLTTQIFKDKLRYLRKNLERQLHKKYKFSNRQRILINQTRSALLSRHGGKSHRRQIDYNKLVPKFNNARLSGMKILNQQQLIRKIDSVVRSGAKNGIYNEKYGLDEIDENDLIENYEDLKLAKESNDLREKLRKEGKLNEGKSNLSVVKSNSKVCVK